MDSQQNEIGHRTAGRHWYLATASQDPNLQIGAGDTPVPLDRRRARVGKPPVPPDPRAAAEQIQPALDVARPTPVSLHWSLPCVVSGILLFTNLGGRGVLNGHEVLVAQTAREMLETGDWALPCFAGEPRLHKPPLGYWLTVVSYRLTGRIDEFAARLPSALATVVGVASVAWFGGRCFGTAVGLVAGMMHATTYWVIAHGKLAEVDAVMAVLVAGAILLAALDQLPGCRPSTSAVILAFWLVTGLAVLAKGPVGPAVILPTVLLYRTLRARRAGDRPFLVHWATIPGLTIFAALALGWPLVVYCRQPGAPELWFAQSVGRFLEHWGPNSRPWFYYFYLTPALTLPWSPAWIYELVVQLRAGWRRARPFDEGVLLMWLWFGVALAFFSLSAGKREHYILPCLAPLSLLAARGFCRWHDARCAPARHTDPNGPLLGPVVPGRWLWELLISAILLFEVLITPLFLGRPGTLAMFDRQRAVIGRASRIIQFGSTDRWAIFPLNRPMTWARSAAAVAAALDQFPDALLLVSEPAWPDLEKTVAGDVLDRTSPTGPAERHLSRRWLLVQPRMSSSLQNHTPFPRRRQQAEQP